MNVKENISIRLEYVYESVKIEDLFLFWYLLVGELQETNQDEERKRGANPFWEKLRRGKLESRVQHERQGRAYL